MILALAAVFKAPALTAVIVDGLLAFGGVFALNLALHSYLILAFSKSERVTMDVGFCYMSNAAGRLIGTILSGLCYQLRAVAGCLGMAAVMSGDVVAGRVVLSTASVPDDMKRSVRRENNRIRIGRLH